MRDNSRPERSGKLGENFCREEFGIDEDDDYEIKSTCRRNNQVVLKVFQLIQSIHKMYVAVRYERKHRTLKRGPRKGVRVADETIEAAYKKHLDVFCATGVELLKIIENEGRHLRSTSYENDAAWAPYWTVRIKSFNQTVLCSSERVTVHGDPLNPPRFLDDDGETPF